MLETVYRTKFHPVQYLENIGPTMKHSDWLILVIFILLSDPNHIIKRLVCPVSGFRFSVYGTVNEHPGVSCLP